MSDRNSRELLEALVQAHPDAIVVVDEEGVIRFANRRCRDLFGRAPADLIGSPVDTLVPVRYSHHAEERRAYVANPTTRLMGGRPVLSARHASGASVPVEIALSPVPPIAGHERLFLAAVRNAMPMFSNHQTMLIQSVAMHAAANGILITDAAGVIEWANPAMTRMTGYTSEELVGQHTRILKSGRHAPSFYRSLWETVLSGETWFGEIANRRKDGTIYHEEQHITPVHDDEGRISHLIAIKQDVTQRRTAEEALARTNAELALRLAEIERLNAQIRDQALRDPLTNLFNRRYLDETLPREIHRARRLESPITVAAIDIDHFKVINDTYGHPVGDDVLIALSDLLLRRTRESDIVCRLGGDELLVVLPGAGLDAAQRRVEGWSAELAEHLCDVTAGRPDLICSLSIGIAALRDDDDSGHVLIARADDALYQAKAAGRGRVVTAP